MIPKKKNNIVPALVSVFTIRINVIFIFTRGGYTSVKYKLSQQWAYFNEMLVQFLLPFQSFLISDSSNSNNPADPFLLQTATAESYVTTASVYTLFAPFMGSHKFVGSSPLSSVPVTVHFHVTINQTFKCFSQGLVDFSKEARESVCVPVYNYTRETGQSGSAPL